MRPAPTSAASQGMVTALFDLIRHHDLTPERTRRLRIYVSPAIFDAYRNRRDYNGKWEASASLHYTAAVVLHDRELWLDQFEPERYEDPSLKRYSQECVELFGDSALTAEQARVEAQMTDGSVVSAHCHASKGTPENPLTRSEIEDKFRRGARDRLSPPAIEHVIHAVSQLEDLKSARSLMAALRAQ